MEKEVTRESIWQKDFQQFVTRKEDSEKLHTPTLVGKKAKKDRGMTLCRMETTRSEGAPVGAPLVFFTPSHIHFFMLE